MSSARWAILWLAVAMPGQFPAAAQSSPPSAAQAEDALRKAKALELARTIQPAEIVVPEAMAVLDKQFVETMLRQPEGKELEAEYPGIVLAIWKAARPLMGDMLKGSLPKLWAQLADIYARHLTTAQIESARAFYGSPTGRKFIALLNRNADLRPMMQQVMKDPNAQISTGAYQDMVISAAGRSADRLSPAEMAELRRFVETSAGAAIVALNPQVQTVGVNWMNETDPEFDARLEEIMLNVVIEHVERQGAKSGKGN